MNKFNVDSIKDFMLKIERFNELAGKSYRSSIDEEWWVAMKNQAERVIEEAQEILEACDKRDVTMLLDGVVDVAVTALPLMPMAQAVGFDVSKANDLVAENNITKIVSDASLARDTAGRYGEEYCYIDNVIVDGINYYPVKRYEDDKLLKPIGYESVNISDCLPM